jgi:ribosomal protein L14
MNAILRCLIAGIAAVCLSPAYGQDAKPATVPTYADWIQFMSNACPKQAVDAVSHPGIAAMFKYRPADIGAICTCTIQKVQADERLRAHLDVEQALLVRRLTPQVQLYGGHRFAYALAACIVPEMDRSLTAVPLE